MRIQLLFILLFSAVFSYGQVKLGEVVRKTKQNVNTVKDKKEKVENTVDPVVGTSPSQDTTKKQEPVKTDEKKTDNLAIGDEGDEKKNEKGGKVKQSKEFIKDSNKGSSTTTTPPKNGGSLVDPNSQKKNIAIEDEGAEDEKKKDKSKPKSSDNNSITPK